MFFKQDADKALAGVSCVNWRENLLTIFSISVQQSKASVVRDRYLKEFIDHLYAKQVWEEMDVWKNLLFFF